MKIILLSPTINAEHKIVTRLKDHGVAILFPANAEEVLQILHLHGSSIDLGIFHKEGIGPKQQNLGLEMISKIKSDPSQADLPIILTTDSWSDEECAKHQESAEGVNAYLKAPFSDDDFIKLIEGVLGQSLESLKQSDPSLMLSTESIPSSENSDGPVLEDISQVFTRPESQSLSELSIQLDAPDVSQSQVSIPTATTLTENILTNLPTATINLELTRGTGVRKTSDLALSLSAGDENEIQHGQNSPNESETALDPVSQVLSLDTENPGNESLQQSMLPSESAPLESELNEIKNKAEPESEAESEDLQVMQEMPYLYGKSTPHTPRISDPSFLFAQTLGDAIVPGGAAQAPDLETLKKYLQLREQDVAILSNQLKAVRDQLSLLEQTLREEKAKNAELLHLANEQKKKIEDFDRDKAVYIEGAQVEMTELKFQLKAKADKTRLMEVQNQELTQELLNLKERVRSDIRKIRVREKELENRLEIVKKDSEALISSRENKIIELKRKLDLVEFNMDLLQDQYTREKENSAQLRERLGKVAQVVRVAGGMLDTSKSGESDASILEGQNAITAGGNRKIS